MFHCFKFALLTLATIFPSPDQFADYPEEKTPFRSHPKFKLAENMWPYAGFEVSVSMDSNQVLIITYSKNDKDSLRYTQLTYTAQDGFRGEKNDTITKDEIIQISYLYETTRSQTKIEGTAGPEHGYRLMMFAENRNFKGRSYDTVNSVTDIPAINNLFYKPDTLSAAP